jgi:hypothetical protein
LLRRGRDKNASAARNDGELFLTFEYSQTNIHQANEEADDFSVRDPNAIRISLGYPDERFFTGADPRGNHAIIRRLMRDGKVITQSAKQVDKTTSNQAQNCRFQSTEKAL